MQSRMNPNARLAKIGFTVLSKVYLVAKINWSNSEMLQISLLLRYWKISMLSRMNPNARLAKIVFKVLSKICVVVWQAQINWSNSGNVTYIFISKILKDTYPIQDES